MRIHRWKDVAERKLGKEKYEAVKARVAREVLEMDLRAVRELIGKTQMEVSRMLEVSQSQLSKIERGDDHLLSTLRKYVKGLGGELEVTARFGDRSIRLHGI